MSWSRVTSVTVESFIHGTVVANTDSWVFFYLLLPKAFSKTPRVSGAIELS